MMLKHLIGIASKNISRVGHKNHEVHPMIDGQVDDRCIEIQENRIAHSEFQCDAIIKTSNRKAIVKSRNVSGPVHHPFTAKNTRSRLTVWNFLITSFVKRVDSDFTIQCGSEKMKFTVSWCFEIKTSDRFKMSLNNVKWQQSFVLLVLVSANIPDCNCATDESCCQNAIAVIFLVPTDFRCLKKILLNKQHMIVFKLANQMRFKRQNDRLNFIQVR